MTYRDVSKKISHLVDPNLLPLEPPPLVDLWDLKILSLNLIIGVDAIGPASNFTIMKIVTRWSPNGQQVVVIRKVKTGIFNIIIIKHVLLV